MLSAALVAATLTANPTWLEAAALEVAPTTIQIEEGTNAALLYITNRGNAPMVAQVEGFDWQQTETGDQLEPTQSLMFSPPMVRLAPGQKQIVRLAIKPEAKATLAATKERAFRLVVSEIPEFSKKRTDVQMVLQFIVPVFASTKEMSDSILWEATPTDGAVLVSARNTGTQHGKLSKINLTNAAGEKIKPVADTFSYILAGASKQWRVELPSSALAQPLRVNAYNELKGAGVSAPLLVNR